MINYVVQHECELCDFPAWSGGARILDELVKHDEAYAFAENYIEEAITEKASNEVTDTFINDVLWFEITDALEEAGLTLIL